MKEEIWKDIKFKENGVEYDFTGLYQVSNYGNIKSLIDSNGDKREKILKPEKTKNGYLRIELHKNKKKKRFYIHRLVAFMFIKNNDTEHNTEVNHIDENKENNSVNNLEFCTRKYNMNFGTRNKRAIKTKNKKVIGYSLTSTKVIVLQSIKQAQNLCFDPSYICKCCNGKAKSHKGFKWFYLNDNKNKGEK